MINFKTELDKLLSMETEPLPDCPAAALLSEGLGAFQSLGKKQTDISLQVEEIYDMAQETKDGINAFEGELKAGAERSSALLDGIIGVCGILEDFRAYAKGSGDGELARQSDIMGRNALKFLEACGITPVGEAGEPLDPSVHSVQGLAVSSLPKEHVAEVLISGYRYMGKIVRKAAVIISGGIV